MKYNPLTLVWGMCEIHFLVSFTDHFPFRQVPSIRAYKPFIGATRRCDNGDVCISWWEKENSTISTAKMRSDKVK